MVTSVGIFFLNKDRKILIGHPTHSSDGKGFWTIPKGKMDGDETEEQTAKREFSEETNLSIDAFPDGKMEHVDREVYVHKKKRISAFVFQTQLDVPEPKCVSFIEEKGNKFPEIDYFAWVDYDEAVEKLHYTQSNILKRNKDKFNAGQ